jgi:hypothetical protein
LLAIAMAAHAQFDYTVSNNAITITGYHGPGGEVVIPATISGLPVKTIGDAAFQNQTNLTSVTIPNGIASIGSRAFYGCVWLFGASLPASLQSISDYAFGNCFQLTGITLPGNLTNLGPAAFISCASLSDVKVPDALTTLGDFAFQACWRLTNVAMGASVGSIGNYAFYNCGGLRTAGFDLALTNLGTACFLGCSNLTRITLPASLTSLGNGAFGGCTRLKAAYFTGNAPYDTSPFYSDDSLTVYYLPGTTGWGPTFSSRPTVLWNAEVQGGVSFSPVSNGFGFTITGSSNLAIVVEACTNLGNPIWSPVATNMLLGGAASFSDAASSNFPLRFYRLTAALPVPYNFSITNGGVTITGYTDPVGWVNIPGTINGLPVAEIGYAAFFNLPAITEVFIPDSVRTIAEIAFADCVNLTNVAIGKNVGSIGAQAFYDCEQLSSITIPGSVTNIAEEAFGRCSSLTQFGVDSANSSYSTLNGVLFDKAQGTLIKFPIGRSGSYTLPGTATNIEAYAFQYSSGLTDIELGNQVRAIGEFAFASCTGLNAVSIPDSVTNLGQYCFGSCSSVSTLLIGNGLTTIGAEAFASCGRLGAVNVPSSIRDIGEGAFEYCSGLTNLTIGANVTNIGSSAFVDCTGLSTISIPDSVTTIGSWAFDYCTGLTNVMVGSGVTNIAAYAFGYCPQVTGFYFSGDAPFVDDTTFSADPNATVYYLPGRSGWGSTLGGLPTAVWNPNPAGNPIPRPGLSGLASRSD